MEKVVLEGVEYIKATEIAKEFKYTSDYVGQLCRAKKIDARLVGRSWFVNKDSLVAHRKGKYPNLRKKQPNTSEVEKTHLNPAQKEVKPVNTFKNKVKVLPVIKSKTMKNLYETSLSLQDFSDGSKSLKVNYERDDEILFPEVKKIKTPPPRKLNIDPAGAIKLHISNKKSEVEFAPTEIPEVSLSGTLSVAGLEEPSELKNQEEGQKDIVKPEKSTKNKNISVRDEKSPAIKVRIKPKSKAVVSVRITDHEKERIREMFGKKPPENKPAPQIAEKKPSVVADFSPKTLDFAKKSAPNSVHEVSFAPSAPEKAKPVKISTAALVSPLIATILALVVVTALFSASQSVFVSDVVYESKVVLQLANLLEILQQK